MTGIATIRKGFTLIETLAAMSLMVVAAACLYSSLYTGFRAKRGAEAAIEPSIVAANAIGIIKQDMLGVLPPNGILAGAFMGTDATDGLGTESDILMLFTTHTHTSDSPATGGISEIELLLESDDDDNAGYKLVRRVTTNLLSPRTLEPEEQVLCRNVGSLNIRYFDGFTWLDEWDSTGQGDTLPLAVEIDLQITYKSSGSAKEGRPCRLIQSFLIPCGVVESQGMRRSGT
jgi:prepilin-type N-terminal cleavage/methylation domain-containing protein